MKLLEALSCRRAGSCEDHATGKVPVTLQLLTSSTLRLCRLVLLRPQAWGRVPLSWGLNERVRFAS